MTCWLILEHLYSWHLINILICKVAFMWFSKKSKGIVDELMSNLQNLMKNKSQGKYNISFNYNIEDMSPFTLSKSYDAFWDVDPITGLRHEPLFNPFIYPEFWKIEKSRCVSTEITCVKKQTFPPPKLS